MQRYVFKHRRRGEETSIPPGHLPGQRLEADFGHIHVASPDGRRTVPFLVTAWAYSNAPFMIALPFERTEAILEGRAAALAFYNAVPEAERQRVVHSLLGPLTIQDRLAQDLAAATPLPGHRFDPCVVRPAVAVDKYRTAAFDGSRYSGPRPFAFEMVTLKGDVDRVVIVARGQVVASHDRRVGKPTMILEQPIPYLAALGRKPGAPDHAPVFRDRKLPACFAGRRAALEGHHGAAAGSRRSARVLQPLGEHPMTRVSRAIEACQRDHPWSAEAVIRRTRSLAAIEAARRGGAATAADAPAAPQVPVPRPDLSAPERPRHLGPRHCVLPRNRSPSPPDRKGIR